MSRVEINEVVQYASGRAALGVPVQVNLRNAGLATVYAGETGGTTLSNPLFTIANGRIEGWLERGSYDLVVTPSGGAPYTQRFEASSGFDLNTVTAEHASLVAEIGVDPSETFATLKARLADWHAALALHPAGTYGVRDEVMDSIRHYADARRDLGMVEGAAGDGNTLNTDALMRLFYEYWNETGATVVLTEGDYYVHGGMYAISNIRYLGVGKVRIICGSGWATTSDSNGMFETHAGDRTNGTNVVFENIEFVIPAGKNTRPFLFNNQNGITVKNCKITQLGGTAGAAVAYVGSGYTPSDPHRRTVFTQNEIFSTAPGNVSIWLLGNDSTHEGLGDVTDIEISYNKVQDRAMFVSIDAYWNPIRDVRIHHNHIKDQLLNSGVTANIFACIVCAGLGGNSGRTWPDPEGHGYGWSDLEVSENLWENYLTQVPVGQEGDPNQNGDCPFLVYGGNRWHFHDNILIRRNVRGNGGNSIGWAPGRTSWPTRHGEFDHNYIIGFGSGCDPDSMEWVKHHDNVYIDTVGSSMPPMGYGMQKFVKSYDNIYLNCRQTAELDYWPGGGLHPLLGLFYCLPPEEGGPMQSEGCSVERELFIDTRTTPVPNCFIWNTGNGYYGYWPGVTIRDCQVIMPYGEIEPDQIVLLNHPNNPTGLVFEGNHGLFGEKFVVTNPSFDTDLTGWTLVDAGTASVTPTRDPAKAAAFTRNAILPAGSLKLVNTTGGEDSYEKQIVAGLNPSTTYRIAVKGQLTAFTAIALSSRGLYAFDTSNEGATAKNSPVDGVIKDINVWFEYCIDVTTTSDGAAGSKSIEIRLYAPHGTIFWDDLVLVRPYRRTLNSNVLTGSVTVGVSPFNYVAGPAREVHYIRGGTVSDITKNGRTIWAGTPAMVTLEPYEGYAVTYSVAPTIEKDCK